MSVKLNQVRFKLRIFNEKTDLEILGEILHNVFESLIIYEKDLFFNFLPEEELVKVFTKYLNKALAFYPEPLPKRKLFLEKGLEILKNIFKNKEIKKLKSLISDAEIFEEVLGFFKNIKADTSEGICYVKPDLLLKKGNNWIILEFKLHKPGSEEQLEEYKDFLQKFGQNDNIKIYLVIFEPFKIEKYEFSSKSYSYPSQLSLFEDFS